MLPLLKKSGERFMSELYTSEDLADFFDVDENYIRKLVNRLKLERTTLEGNHIRYTENTRKACEEYFKNKEKKEAEIRKVKEKAKQEELARLKKEHPLVTDERCFNLNWWPENVLHSYEE